MLRAVCNGVGCEALFDLEQGSMGAGVAFEV